MKVTIIEGTPGEIAKALPDLGKTGSVLVNVKNDDLGEFKNSDASEDDVDYVSTKFARKVITRRDLSNEMKIILIELYNAHPNQILGTELASKTGYTRRQFTGLMGAFGRRIAYTEGFVDNTSFFTYEWDMGASSYRYGLPETVREALRLEKMV